MDDYSDIDNIEELETNLRYYNEKLEEGENYEETIIDMRETQREIESVKNRISELKKGIRSGGKSMIRDKEKIEELERKIAIKRQELESEKDEYKKYLIGVDIKILERRIKYYKEPKWSLF